MALGSPSEGCGIDDWRGKDALRPDRPASGEVDVTAGAHRYALAGLRPSMQ